eukprot:364442-Chlamydomonas_euryale.AAC.1
MRHGRAPGGSESSGWPLICTCSPLPITAPMAAACWHCRRQTCHDKTSMPGLPLQYTSCRTAALRCPKPNARPGASSGCAQKYTPALGEHQLHDTPSLQCHPSQHEAMLEHRGPSDTQSLDRHPPQHEAAPERPGLSETLALDRHGFKCACACLLGVKPSQVGEPLAGRSCAKAI